MTEPTGITCSCGFKVTGEDEDLNQYAFDDHPCTNAPTRRWHESVFSFWGMLIAVTALVAAVEIVETLIGGNQ